MKRIALMCLVLVASLPAVALENGQVRYVGGTTSVPAGAMGSLTTTSETALIFEHPSSKLAIPYADIVSFEYSTPATHHLGVLPAIAVGLLVHRQHRYHFRITYRDEERVEQVAIFEVAKQMGPTIEAILDSRGPANCRANGRCRLPN